MNRSLSLLALLALLAVLAVPARALDVNQASIAELEAVRGIGPALADRIVAARAQAPFADWSDLLRRVAGIGVASATKLSAAGLTVGAAPYAPPPR